MTPRVLLVEDDPDLRLTLSHRFDSEGYRMETATNGEEGLARAAGEAFDIVILDVMLPGRGGFDICRELRQRGVRTPVLMLSARADVVDRVVGLKLGADDYLTKPFEMAELLARVEARVRVPSRRERGTPAAYRFGDVYADFEKSEVSVGGRPVALSAKELQLLRYLVAHAGTSVTRDELLKEVWGYEAMPLTRTVDVHVAWLRRKVEPQPRHPRYILTVHGRGYKFVG
jgi:two-component system alkaline phosphatase synthesis response regulator PhoP